jgi:hypothetical protein
VGRSYRLPVLRRVCYDGESMISRRESIRLGFMGLFGSLFAVAFKGTGSPNVKLPCDTRSYTATEPSQICIGNAWGAEPLRILHFDKFGKFISERS